MFFLTCFSPSYFTVLVIKIIVINWHHFSVRIIWAHVSSWAFCKWALTWLFRTSFSFFKELHCFENAMLRLQKVQAWVANPQRSVVCVNLQISRVQLSLQRPSGFCTFASLRSLFLLKWSTRGWRKIFAELKDTKSAQN